MLEEIRRDGRWRCFAKSNSSCGVVQYVDSLHSLNDLLRQVSELPVIFKDNHRSRVLKGELFPSHVFDRSIVAKQARNKNSSLWSRVLSLFRWGEARQTFLALLRFQQLGITAGEPILVLEKRYLGVIVDSWVVYEYLAGEPVQLEQLPEIIEVLTTIHEAGYQHKDPTLGNFFNGVDGKLFVIDCVLRAGLGNFSRCRDLMMMVDNNDGVSLDQIEPSLRPYQGTLGYRRFYRRARDAVKYKIRGRKPKNK